MIQASDLNSDNKIDEEEFIAFALNHQQQGFVVTRCGE
jgi:hypothetical protein